MTDREIKFRFWDNNNLRWCDTSPRFPSTIQFSSSEILAFVKAEIFRSVLLKGEIVVQQFIGIQDKKGTDIYEGDIVEIYLTGPVETSKPNIGKVIWDNEDLCFYLEVKLPSSRYRSGIVKWGFEYTELTVLGNIFEGVDK